MFKFGDYYMFGISSLDTRSHTLCHISHQVYDTRVLANLVLNLSLFNYIA